MAFLLKIIKSFGIKDGLIAVLAVAVLFVANEWHKASVEAKNVKEIYSHPEVKTVEKIVYKTGPVRIKTVVIKEKSGNEKTIIEEDRGPETTVTETSDESKIAPLSSVLARPRSDRYLLSVGFNRLSPDWEGKAIFVGYGFRNRLDIQVGGVRKEQTTPWVLATFRF